MARIDIITEYYPDEEFLQADGFDRALSGVMYDKINGVHRLVYSRAISLDILMKRDDMSFEEAVEFFDFNVEGAYMGEKTPVWLDDEMWDCEWV